MFATFPPENSWGPDRFCLWVPLDIGNLSAILGTLKSVNTASEREVPVSEIKFDSSLACLLKHVCDVQLDMSLT